MESQPQNPEFRVNPENFHPCIEDTMSKKGILYNYVFPLKYPL